MLVFMRKNIYIEEKFQSMDLPFYAIELQLMVCSHRTYVGPGLGLGT